jgi:hypothetical protein
MASSAFFSAAVQYNPILPHSKAAGFKPIPAAKQKWHPIGCHFVLVRVRGLELSRTHALRAPRVFLAVSTAFCFAKPKNSVSPQEPIIRTSKK